MTQKTALGKSRLMIIAAMAIFGTLGPFVRNIYIPSAALALCRAVMAVALLGLYFLMSGQRIDFRDIRKELPLLLFSGMAIGVNWILLFEAYRYTTVSVATLSYYFAPVLVTMACPLLFHEKMETKQWICFAMSTLGIVLITGVGDLSGNNRHLTGILLGLAAAVLYACIVLLNKQLADISAYDRTVVQLGVCAVVMLVYCAATVPLAELKFAPATVGLLLVAGVLHTGVTYYLYFGSMAYLSGQTAAILSYVDPVVAVLVSVLVLAEPMHPVELLGAALVLGAALASELEKPA